MGSCCSDNQNPSPKASKGTQKKRPTDLASKSGAKGKKGKKKTTLESRLEESKISAGPITKKKAASAAA